MPTIEIDVAFNIEDVVYLTTDREQLPRVVIGLSVKKYGVMYNLGCGASDSWHWDFEMTAEPKNAPAAGFNTGH